MATNINQKRFIERRKEQGLCLKCGNPLDRKGVYCIKCNNELNEEHRKTEQAYIDAGICYRCRVNPIMGDEKRCPECRAKFREWRSQRPDEKKQRDKELTELSHERRRQECRDNGICYICKKRKAEPGKKRCSICREKSNRKNRECYQRKSNRLTREQRIEKGICIWCDNKAKPGKKLCEDCCNKSIRNVEDKRKPNEQWRKYNQLTFKN